MWGVGGVWVGGGGVFCFSSRRGHARFTSDGSSGVCSSDLSAAVVVSSSLAAVVSFGGGPGSFATDVASCKDVSGSLVIVSVSSGNVAVSSGGVAVSLAERRGGSGCSVVV